MSLAPPPFPDRNSKATALTLELLLLEVAEDDAVESDTRDRAIEVATSLARKRVGLARREKTRRRTARILATLTKPEPRKVRLLP